jgi:hypothetical protein
MKIGEIATAATGDSNFFPQLRRMVKQQYGPASPACLYGTHHPRSTRAYNGHIFLEFHHFNSIPCGSGQTCRKRILLKHNGRASGN